MNQTTIKELTNKMKTGNIFGLFHNDLDGYGCGQVASTYLNVKEASHLSYKRVNKEINNFCKEGFKNYDGLIVADLNLDIANLEKLAKLAETGYPIMYFDHHFKTSEHIEFLKKTKIFNMFTSEFCATKIMFNYFSNNGFNVNVENINIERYSKIVDMIDAWDTFKFQDPNTFEIINDDARDLNIYFQNFGVVKTLEKINNYITGKFDNLFSNMEISNIKLLKREIRRAVNDRNKNLAVIKFHFNGEVMDIGITYAEKDISEIGNRLNIMNKHLSFIVVIDMVHNSVNFRTIFDKPDVNKIAALYGGGGHPKAAGCELNDAAFNAFVNKTLNREQTEALLTFNMKKENTEAAAE